MGLVESCCTIDKPLFTGFCPGNRGFLKFGLFVESRIGEVNVLLIHALFCQRDRFAEVINLSNLFNSEICCDFMHMLVTEDPAGKAPLCGAIQEELHWQT